MALNPNVPVVAPGELITAAHHNAVRSNLDRLDTTKLALTGAASQTVAGNLTTTGNQSAGPGPTASLAGSLMRNDGLIQSSVVGGGGAPNSLPNLVLVRTGTPAQDAGGVFARFDRTSAGTTIGSITIVAGGAGVAYNQSSDYRLKNELGPLVDPLGRILALRPIRFTWTTDERPEPLVDEGFLAHEVAEHVPHAVTGDKDAVRPADDEWSPGAIDPQQLNATALIPLLVGAVQELSAANQALAARIEALEGGAPT